MSNLQGIANITFKVTNTIRDKNYVKRLLTEESDFDVKVSTFIDSCNKEDYDNFIKYITSTILKKWKLAYDNNSSYPNDFGFDIYINLRIWSNDICKHIVYNKNLFRLALFTHIGNNVYYKKFQGHQVEGTEENPIIGKFDSNRIKQIITSNVEQIISALHDADISQDFDKLY